ncbi:MAG: LemA family protein [Acidimicrobiales bacterium]
MTPLIVLAVVVVLVLGAVLMYNGMVKARNNVDNGWSQIDVQLHRRYDLIPNLVETVKGYAAHESKTFEAVTAARNAGMSATTTAEQTQADNMMTSALKSLFAVSEAYPELKANENFLNLQEELSATEGRIAYARQYFNDAVLRYNTKIQSFPAVMFASAFGFKVREFFEADDTTRGPTRVQF